MTALALPRRGDRYVWTQPDGAVIFCEVKRVTPDGMFLRCHHGDRSWTRHHHGPPFASMVCHDWTSADLLDQIGAQP